MSEWLTCLSPASGKLPQITTNLLLTTNTFWWINCSTESSLKRPIAERPPNLMFQRPWQRLQYRGSSVTTEYPSGGLMLSLLRRKISYSDASTLCKTWTLARSAKSNRHSIVVALWAKKSTEAGWFLLFTRDFREHSLLKKKNTSFHERLPKTEEEKPSQ